MMPHVHLFFGISSAIIFTILGVMVGVSSVIGMAAIIDGLNGAMNEEIDSLGSNVIWITKFEQNVDRSKLSDEDRNRPPITENEAHVILTNCDCASGRIARTSTRWRFGPRCPFCYGILGPMQWRDTGKKYRGKGDLDALRQYKKDLLSK